MMTITMKNFSFNFFFFFLIDVHMEKNIFEQQPQQQ